MHATVLCVDPEHRDHQHAQTQGTVVGFGQNAVLDFAVVAWDGIREHGDHDVRTLERVYRQPEVDQIRNEYQQELERSREET